MMIMDALDSSPLYTKLFTIAVMLIKLIECYLLVSLQAIILSYSAFRDVDWRCLLSH
jgi:hypothetical protein